MSFKRVVLSAGLTSLTLGLLARSWSWMRHGPAKVLPPPDCPAKGARVAGLAVARRERGFLRGAPVVVLVHDRGSTGAVMLEAFEELEAPALVLAPTGPMPTSTGAAWLWAEPTDPGFAEALASAAEGLAACLREL